MLYNGLVTPLLFQLIMSASIERDAIWQGHHQNEISTKIRGIQNSPVFPVCERRVAFRAAFSKRSKMKTLPRSIESDIEAKHGN